MAKKKTKQSDSPVGFNGTPFSKERFDELKALMAENKDTKFIWDVFNEYYSSTIRLAYRELLETQKFFIGLLGEARTKFGSIEENSDIDLAEEMTKWVKSLQSISDGILFMRGAMISVEQASEIELEAAEAPPKMSLIDEMAISKRKKDRS